MNISPAKSGLKPCWCAGNCPHVAKLRALHEQRAGIAATETAAKLAMIDAPDCAKLHSEFAKILNATNRAQCAVAHVSRAIEVEGYTPELVLQLASSLRNEASIPAALSIARDAVALNPQNPVAPALLADCLLAAGHIDEALETVEKAEITFGRHTALRRTHALLFAERKDFAGAVALLQGELAPLELFDRGRFHESMGAYDRAWADWMEGKRIQREKFSLTYDAPKVAEWFADLHEVSRPPRLDALYKAGCRPAETTEPLPLFVTGFPRSGTTMVEAVFAAHPEVAPGDELGFLPEICQRLPMLLAMRAPYPRAMMALTWPDNATVPSIARDWYLRKAHLKALQSWDLMKRPPPRYFTDKMPSNECHLLLIQLLFPEAPVVHLRRHPLDVLLSCMSHNLIHGWHNATGLESCATHYAMTDALIQHYRRKLHRLNFFEVRYESFVADHRAGVDALLRFADLSHQEACYDFHLSEWHSRTISHRQIKAPVTASSVGRYKPFLEFLEPILPIVAPIMEREGYSL